MAAPYSSIAAFTHSDWSREASKNSNVSSANKRWGIPRALLQIFTGVFSPVATLFFRMVDNPSATNRNRSGESALPCRRPRVGANESKRVSLNLTEYHNDVTHVITQLIHWWEKPNFCITRLKNTQSTRSYAFDRSGLYAWELFVGSFSCLI